MQPAARISDQTAFSKMRDDPAGYLVEIDNTPSTSSRLRGSDRRGNHVSGGLG
jgi:hypothetical protein